MADSYTWTDTGGEVSSFSIRSLSWDGSGLYAGTDSHGVWRYDPGTSTWTDTEGGVSSYSISSLAWDGSGLYAGTDSHGVWRYDPGTSTWTDTEGGVSGFSIPSLAWDGSGLYAGTRYTYDGGSGVWRYDPGTSAWSNIGNSIINSYFIDSMALDGSGLYVSPATGHGGGAGISRYDFGTSQWSTTGAPFDNSHIYALAWDGSGLYAGAGISYLGGYGVWRYNPDTSTWTDTRGGVSDFGISSLAWDGSGLYAGTFDTSSNGLGVWRYNPDTSTWTDTGGEVGGFTIPSLAWDGSGLYAGTYGHGVWYCQTSYDVTAQVSGSHGSVAPSSQKVKRGGNAIIKFTLDPGYYISSIIDNGKPASRINPYVISNVTSKHDVVVAFASEGTNRIYFAEGYTGQDAFDEWLCLMNPGTAATTAHITYMFTDGSTQYEDVLIGATTRATVKVNDQVGPDRDVSMKITADAPIVAERPMYFNYNGAWTGGHDVIGATSPQKTFYFAEGYTGQDAFDEWLCLMNPGTAATTAHITYMFSDGTTQYQDVLIGATTRATVKVNDQVGPDRDVSMKITADAPIVAERPMYFNYNGAWTGGHDVIGATSPQKTFYFAEGYTGQDAFDEYLCLMNPGTSATTAHITYMFSDGTTQKQDVTIGATSRATVNVNDQVGLDKDVSVKITSDIPIVAERPMYFNYSGQWTGGHDVIGVTASQPTFYFAEGYTGANFFNEYLCLMNPGTSATTAHITYMFSDGTTQKQDVTIGATSRATVNVNDQVGLDKDVSLKITSDIPIVAERPMYFNYSGIWTGGHDVVGYTP